MPVLSIIRVGRYYYRTTMLREVRKLLDLSKDDDVEWLFEDSRVVIRKGGKSG